MLINNDRGSISLLSLTLLLLVTVIGLKLIDNKLTYIKKNKILIRNYLCAKEFNGETKRYIFRIENLNTAIKGLNTSGIVSIIIPGGAIITSASYRAKKIIQKIQTVLHISYVKNLIVSTSKGCIFSPNAYKTPYRNQVYRLKRNKFGLAKLRSKKWNVYSVSGKHVLKTKFDYKTRRKKNLTSSEFIPML